MAAAWARHELHFVDEALGLTTAYRAEGSPAVAIFVGDDASAPVLERLAARDMRYLLVRAAGRDQVDLPAAQRLGLRVANVPPLLPLRHRRARPGPELALNRHLHQANAQVRRTDFRLDALVGFDLHGKPVGIGGGGTIGGTVAGLRSGFGCRLPGHDAQPDAALTQRYGVAYGPLDTLCARADVVALHALLTPATRQLFNAGRLANMKRGAVLVNTSRGGANNWLPRTPPELLSTSCDEAFRLSRPTGGRVGRAGGQ